MKGSGGRMETNGDFWIHPDAIVETDSIGAGTRIHAFCHVMAGTVVGERCNLGEHVFVETGAVIGDRVTVKNGVQVWEGVRLEANAFVGPNVVFLNDRYPRSPRSPAAGDRYATKDWLQETLVQEGGTIGGNATILPGLQIGRYALVAAGAVVTKSVPAHGVVMGAPAREVGYVCTCGRRLGAAKERQYACTACGRTLLDEAGVLREASPPAGEKA